MHPGALWIVITIKDGSHVGECKLVGSHSCTTARSTILALRTVILDLGAPLITSTKGIGEIAIRTMMVVVPAITLSQDHSVICHLSTKGSLITHAQR